MRVVRLGKEIWRENAGKSPAMELPCMTHNRDKDPQGKPFTCKTSSTNRYETVLFSISFSPQ